MRIHYFQHVPFEGFGSIEEWIKKGGHSLDATRLYKGDKIPSLEDVDCLIVMGGPMSVHDEKEYPWLKQEKGFICSAIENRKIVLGICLGAQLIADVLGAKVYPNHEKEIGWFPIQFSKYAEQLHAFQNLNSGYTVFHWHGDTFELPAEALHLASSAACKNQAFLYHKRVLGLQFHLETTKNSLNTMILHGREELIPGKFVQTEKEIISGGTVLNNNKKVLFSLLDEMAKV